jgi:C-terminal processing protease CtpA/Prc
MKYSHMQKKRDHQYFINSNDSDYFGCDTIPDGFIDNEEEDSSLTQLRSNPIRFNGQIILLTSASTFSSAADFANCFKHYKMGTIIGEETGGWVDCYGDLIPATLPNTKLQMNISDKFFIAVGSDGTGNHGVYPDVEVSSDQALDYAIDMFKKK